MDKRTRQANETPHTGFELLDQEALDSLSGHAAAPATRNRPAASLRAHGLPAVSTPPRTLPQATYRDAEEIFEDFIARPSQPGINVPRVVPPVGIAPPARSLEQAAPVAAAKPEVAPPREPRVPMEAQAGAALKPEAAAALAAGATTLAPALPDGEPGEKPGAAAELSETAAPPPVVPPVAVTLPDTHDTPAATSTGPIPAREIPDVRAAAARPVDAAPSTLKPGVTGVMPTIPRPGEAREAQPECAVAVVPPVTEDDLAGGDSQKDDRSSSHHPHPRKQPGQKLLVLLAFGLVIACLLIAALIRDIGQAAERASNGLVPPVVPGTLKPGTTTTVPSGSGNFVIPGTGFVDGTEQGAVDPPTSIVPVWPDPFARAEGPVCALLHGGEILLLDSATDAQGGRAIKVQRRECVGWLEDDFLSPTPVGPAEAAPSAEVEGPSGK